MHPRRLQNARRRRANANVQHMDMTSEGDMFEGLVDVMKHCVRDVCLGRSSHCEIAPGVHDDVVCLKGHIHEYERVLGHARPVGAAIVLHPAHSAQGRRVHATAVVAKAGGSLAYLRM